MVSYFSSSLGEWDPGSRWKELIVEEWVKETGKLLLDHWIMWKAGIGTLWVSRCLKLTLFLTDNVGGFSHFPRNLLPLVPYCWWKYLSSDGHLWLLSQPKGISWYFHLFSAVIFLLLQMTLRQLLGWSHEDSLSWITLEKHSCTLCPSKLWEWRSPVQPPQFASAIRIANLSLAI